MLTSNQKGNVAEAAIALEAIKLGIHVLRPVTEHCRYDLAFDLGPRLVRVQCKWAVRRNGTVCIPLTSCWYRSDGQQVKQSYAAGEVDAVAAYCDELSCCYLVPSARVSGRSELRLRLSAPRNNQRAAINWAKQYLLSGAVAQLGERRHGMAEVRGSSPLSSTLHAHSTEGHAVVGANAFRDRFGYWMERAAAGEDVLITRHGRPLARLGPIAGSSSPRRTDAS
jgi:prevent-host-death family protein